MLFTISKDNLEKLPIDYKVIGEVTDSDVIELTLENGFVEYIKNNPSEKITIEMLCKKFFFTKSNLFRRFKLAMDCSISEYIYFVKIGLAKDLLYKTNKSIEEIAFLCGFSSLNYFSLMFKKKVGVSPANYRKTK